MKIPKQFVIHGHTINVREVDTDLDERYGYYDSVREEIVVARRMKVDGETISLSDTQIEATFWHELFHAFQWHIKRTVDETEAQSYSGLMIEFLKTSGIKIDPHVIHEPVTNTYDE